MVSDPKLTETPVCNCEDKTITFPCPVHGKVAKPSPDPEDKANAYATILTDEHLASPEIQTWVGHTFTCQNKECGHQIMYFMQKCWNCGTPVVVRSKVVTDHIRKFSQITT